MFLEKLVRVIRAIVDPIARWMNFISVGVLVVMIFFVAVDVIGRYAFERPLQSSYEGVQLMMVLVFSFGISYTQRKKGHVAVDMLVNRFGRRSQAITDLFVNLLCLVFLSVLTWQTLVKAGADFRTGESSLGKIGGLFYVPIYPFYYMVSLTIGVLALTFLLEFLISVVRVFIRPDFDSEAPPPVIGDISVDKLVKQ
jgi:TRAP-type C4-dicarboxylate transport system permease small subunit